MSSHNVKLYVGCHHMEKNKIFVLLLLGTTVATCSFIRTNKLNNNALAADTTSNRITATSINKSATPNALPTYVWGYTTKYATVLYDEDIIVKGLNASLDIKYPENVSLYYAACMCNFFFGLLNVLSKIYVKYFVFFSSPPIFRFCRATQIV